MVPLAQGRRRYEVSLLRDSMDLAFIKLTEFSGNRHNSLLLAAADATKFLVELQGLAAEARSGGGKKAESYVVLACSLIEGKRFELNLSENHMGKFYRLKEKNHLNNLRPLGHVMMEFEGHDLLVSSIEKVLATLDKDEQNQTSSVASPSAETNVKGSPLSGPAKDELA